MSEHKEIVIGKKVKEKEVLKIIKTTLKQSTTVKCIYDVDEDESLQSIRSFYNKIKRSIKNINLSKIDFDVENQDYFVIINSKNESKNSVKKSTKD